MTFNQRLEGLFRRRAQPLRRRGFICTTIFPYSFRLIQPEDQAGGDDDDEVQYSSRLELREDRLVIIEPWIAGGVQFYQYTMRAVNPGCYILPGTRAEGMYGPERKAILAGGRVTAVNLIFSGVRGGRL